MHTSTCEVENQSEPAVSTENSTRCSVTIYIGKGPGKERIYVSRSAQFSRSVVSDSATPWTAAHQASLSITNSRGSLKLMSTESVMPSNHLILSRPLLLLLSTFLRMRVFSNESVLPIRWPQYWSFSFNISPSNEYSRLISFRMDWLDLLAVQGTLKSLLQHTVQKHKFFGTQLSLESNSHIHT